MGLGVIDTLKQQHDYERYRLVSKYVLVLLRLFEDVLQLYTCVYSTITIVLSLFYSVD